MITQYAPVIDAWLRAELLVSELARLYRRLEVVPGRPPGSPRLCCRDRLAGYIEAVDDHEGA
jgi:hypothetical protein